jgi:hypothetical protein
MSAMLQRWPKIACVGSRLIDVRHPKWVVGTVASVNGRVFSVEILHFVQDDRCAPSARTQSHLDQRPNALDHRRQRLQVLMSEQAQVVDQAVELVHGLSDLVVRGLELVLLLVGFEERGRRGME